jgi:hypothetical protein
MNTNKQNNQREMARLMSKGNCLHMLSGLISYGLCTYGYNCAKCSLDQMIEDTHFLPVHRAAVTDATLELEEVSH